MSIRLKKVEWKNASDSLAVAAIAGVRYECYRTVRTWIPTIFGKAISHSYDTLDAAKAACEQHALERIREAVEVDESLNVPAPVLCERLNKLVTDLNNLINDSAGVAGLHLNGDLAPWDELTKGGKYEEWLLSLWCAEETLRSYENRNSQASLDSSNSPEIPDGWQPILELLRDKYERLRAMYAEDENTAWLGGNHARGSVAGSMRVTACLILHDLERLIAGEEIDFPDHLPKPPKEAAT